MPLPRFQSQSKCLIFLRSEIYGEINCDIMGLDCTGMDGLHVHLSPKRFQKGPNKFDFLGSVLHPGSLGASLGPKGVPEVPLGCLLGAFWQPFGCLVGSLGDLGGLLGLPWSSFGLPWVFLGSFRVPFVCLCRALGLFLDPLGHLWWFLLSQCGRTKENTNEESAYRESRGQTKHKFREAGNYQRP